MRMHLHLQGRRHRVLVEVKEGKFTAVVDGDRLEGTIDAARRRVRVGDWEVAYETTHDGVKLDGRPLRVSWEADLDGGDEGAAESVAGAVRPLMPGRVVAVLVQEGDRVERGKPLVVLEAMKMQNEVAAPSAGTVAAVRVRPGDRVSPADVLVELR